MAGGLSGAVLSRECTSSGLTGLGYTSEIDNQGTDCTACTAKRGEIKLTMAETDELICFEAISCGYDTDCTDHITVSTRMESSAGHHHHDTRSTLCTLLLLQGYAISRGNRPAERPSEARRRLKLHPEDWTRQCIYYDGCPHGHVLLRHSVG